MIKMIIEGDYCAHCEKDFTLEEPPAAVILVPERSLGSDVQGGHSLVFHEKCFGAVCSEILTKHALSGPLAETRN